MYIMNRGVTYVHNFAQIRRFLLFSGTIDILCSVYSNFCAIKMIVKIQQRFFSDSRY